MLLRRSILGIKNRTGSSNTRFLSFMIGGTFKNRVGTVPSHFMARRGVKTPTIDWNPLKSKTTNLAAAEHMKKTSTMRIIVLGLMIAMPVISFFLGCWQVKRLKWKVALIAKCENALAEPPIEDLPAKLDPNVIPEFEYRRFKVKGHFDYSQEMFLGPRIKNGIQGYLLVVPFVRSSGGEPILVERGWILRDKVIPETRNKGYLSHLAMPKGEIEINALFRVMPSKSYLQYDHTDGSRLFLVPDVESMAKQAGTLPIYCQMIHDMKDHVEWRENDNDESKKSWFSFSNSNTKKNISDELYVASEADNDSTLEYQEFEFIDQGVPIAQYPKIKLTNNHLQYLVTWFGLSAASAGLLIYTFWKKRKYSSAEKVIEARKRDMQNKF